MNNEFESGSNEPEYCEIHGIGKGQVLTFSLEPNYQEGHKCYKITVAFYENSEQEISVINDFSTDYDFAKRFYNAICKNEVFPFQLYDVAENVLAEMEVYD